MNETKPIKGYKVFDKDWKCRDFQFKEIIGVDVDEEDSL